jgi:hypothetical protein
LRVNTIHDCTAICNTMGMFEAILNYVHACLKCVCTVISKARKRLWYRILVCRTSSYAYGRGKSNIKSTLNSSTIVFSNSLSMLSSQEILLEAETLDLIMKISLSVMNRSTRWKILKNAEHLEKHCRDIKLSNLDLSPGKKENFITSNGNTHQKTISLYIPILGRAL